MKPFTFFLLLIACGIHANAQTPVQPATRRPVVSEARQPMYFLDSVQIIPAELAEVNPNEIVFTSSLKGKDPHSGQQTTSAVFFETKKFVRNRYWLIFSQNETYRKLVPSPDKDDDALYILDGNIVGAKPEMTLAAVNMKTFESIAVVDEATFAKLQATTSKKYMVVVTLKKKK